MPASVPSEFWAPHPTNLTTSRINRLLRPLRNRCSALAAFLSDAARISAPPILTYSSADLRQPDLPPLSVLQPPDNLGVRIHFDKGSIQNLELSRKIYVIRDAFRDIVVKSAAPVGQSCTTDSSLSAICSTVVGNCMVEEVSSSSDGEDCDDLYEAVPIQHRGWTLLSHSVSIILNTCPFHPSLLIILLDVVMHYRLVHQADTLFRALLSVAVSSPENQRLSPAICHSAHSIFLVDWRERWIAAGLPNVTFLHALLDVFSQSDDPAVWKSKALAKLANKLCKCDFSSLLFIMCELASIIKLRKKGNYRSNDCSAPNMHGLLEQLLIWTNLTSEHYYLLVLENKSTESFDAVFNFLQLAGSCNFHIELACPECTKRCSDMVATIASFASQWLASQPASAYSSSHMAAIGFLRNIKPSTTTYDRLMKLIFGGKEFKTSRETLDIHSRALRSRGLLLLEASFWGCALRHLEDPSYDCSFKADRFSSSGDISKYRQHLMDLVDEAEERCFGISMPYDIGPIGGSPDNEDRCIPENKWEWESAIGCWVLSSSESRPNKKRCIRMQDIHSPDSISNAGKHMISETSPQPPSNHRKHKSKKKNADEAPRRSSNFTSMLSDSLSNRTILHSKRSPRSKENGIFSSCSSSEPERRKLYTRDPMCDFHVYSDDGLDLFSFKRSSSPIPISSLG